MISRCAAEVDAWREVKDGWRPLYGDVDQFGVAVEWHDFRTVCSFDWGRSFHPRSLEFCLNLQGHGAVGAVGRKQSDYVPGDSGDYAGRESRPDSLVSKQSARVNGAFSLRTEGSGIFLHATKTSSARPGGADQTIAGARSGQPANIGDAWTGSRLQSVLLKSDFFARSRPHYSAISPQHSDGTRRRAFTQRPLQRERGSG